MKFDEVLLPLEAELPDLRPGEGVDLGVVLEDQDAHVGHCQVQGNSLVILEIVTAFNTRRLGIVRL